MRNRVLVLMMAFALGSAIGGCVAIGTSAGVWGSRPLPKDVAIRLQQLDDADWKEKVDRRQKLQLEEENELIRAEIKALKESIGGNPDGLWNALNELQADISRFGRIVRATDKWAHQRGYVAGSSEIPLPLTHDELTEYQAIMETDEPRGDQP